MQWWLESPISLVPQVSPVCSSKFLKNSIDIHANRGDLGQKVEQTPKKNRYETMKREGNKSHKTNAKCDVDTSDEECARIEFEDETETVPVLHYVHKDDTVVKLDQSAISDEKESRKRRKHLQQHISNQFEGNENTSKDVSKGYNNRISETTTTTPKIETDVQNGSTCNLPTVSEHVSTIQRSEAYIQAYPKEYTENMFLEATLTYVPPVDEVVGDLRMEKRDAEVQTSAIADEESVPENKTDEEEDVNAPTEKEGDVEIPKNVDSEASKSEEQYTTNRVDENEANNDKDISAHDGPEKVETTEMTDEQVPAPNHSQLSTNCMASEEMFTTCDKCGNIVRNEINDTESEKNWSDYYSEYAEYSRVSTPKHKFVVPKSKISPMEVKGELKKFLSSIAEVIGKISPSVSHSYGLTSCHIFSSQKARKLRQKCHYKILLTLLSHFFFPIYYKNMTTKSLHQSSISHIHTVLGYCL